MFDIFKKKYTKVDTILEKLKEEKTESFYNIIYSKDNEKDNDIYKSKVGGYPYWDNKDTYPKDSNGNMLYMVFQINFKELNDSRFPSEGILQLFISKEDNFYGIDTANYNVQKDWKFVFHEKVNYSLSINDITAMGLPSNEGLSEVDFPVIGTHYITYEEKKDIFVPDYSTKDNMIKDMIKKCFNEDINGKTYNYFPDKEYRYLTEKLSCEEKNYSSCSRLLGYADFYYDFREKNNKYLKYDRLLLQLGSCHFINWGGDMGNMYIFISKDNLLKKDFSDVCFFVEI